MFFNHTPRGLFRAGFFIFLFSVTPLFSANKTWLGVTSSSWSDGNNWSPAGVPGPSDDVLIKIQSFAPVLDATTDIAS
ncbi:MAG TPA: hypothetical protein ENJ10_14450, partial [Caldithrix abyssi]|nr:hypothetical protein [Caldithrix abyssi]